MNDFFIQSTKLTLVASGQFAITMGLYRDGTQVVSTPSQAVP